MMATLPTPRPNTAAKHSSSRMSGIEVNTLYSHSSASPTLPPKKPASAPSSVPITVAITAPSRPTNTEVCVPRSVFASTSRPRRSPPKGSVSAFGTSVVLYFRARSSHSL